VTHAREYAIGAPWPLAARRLAERLAATVPQLWALMCLVAGGLAMLRFSRVAPPTGRAYVAGFFAFSLAGVCAGLYFRPHYFLLLAPAAALLVGVAAAEWPARAETPATRRVASVIVTAVVVLALAQSIWAQRHVMLRATPTQVSRALYLASPFPEAVEVARYVRDRSDATDTIAVLGSEPEIPFYARRRSATRHLYMYPLMDAQPAARAMQAELIAEIEHARPRYIVLVRTDGSWSRGALSPPLVFEWMQRFLPERYARIGQVDIRGPDETRYHWDADVAGVDVTPYTHIIVFRRLADR
jgi:hypothetical protein